MNHDLRLRINKPSVVFEKFDDELVLINLDNGNYYSFEKVGGDIWSLIQNGASETTIIEEILQKYSGSSTAVEDEVKKFLTELKQEGLIVPDENHPAEDRLSPNTRNRTESGPQKIPFESPVLNKFTNMQDFLLVDPIHEIDYTEWPQNKPK